ncbi:S8 family serine peptidase [Halarchaeum sp. P4]|uniref:S8 family serine peptidase n=1 Tax=Halarchaeum sp. P4 TaxID=3421639 RepID=UPI003EB6F8CC
MGADDSVTLEDGRTGDVVQPPDDVPPPSDGGVAKPGQPPAHSNGTGPPNATVPASLARANGTVTVVVRLDDPSLPPGLQGKQAKGRLKNAAEKKQQPLVRFSNGRSGVTVVNRFWIANMVLLRVDTERVDVSEIARVEHVERLHRNFEVSIPNPSANTTNSTGATSAASTADADAGYNVTYGLEQVNATGVWKRYDTKGGGVKVAVLDTGVDVSHPDIELYTRDPSDPTYPGGWAEFGPKGQRVADSRPHDTDYHGTHVSGTVTGGNASGQYIGVAPNASLMHGLVLPEGSGSFTQIIAGMQWAVENDADVVSMSLGSEGAYPSFIEPVRNARAAGTLVVTAAGNEGANTSGSPANVYESLAVGATDEQRDVTWFSSGDAVDTRQTWYPFAPESWPSEYVVPDVAAPGDDVRSAVPQDHYSAPYAEADGTSMAAPHVAGTAALALAAANGTTVSQVTDAVTSAARKPADCSPSCAPRDGNDTRYGAGIVDAVNATDRLAATSGIEGVVTDASGDPVVNATVALDDFTVRTDRNGHYVLRESADTYRVRANAFGYAPETRTATVNDSTFTTLDVSLTPELALAVTSNQSDAVRVGNATSVTFRAANVDTWTVERTGDFTGNATLRVNGAPASFGESVAITNDSETVTVTVHVTDGSGNLSLAHTVTGMGETTTVTTGPTRVVEELPRVAVVGAYKYGYAPTVMRVLDNQLPANYRLDFVAATDVHNVTEQYDVFVVQNFGHQPSAERVQQFAAATDDPATGVVYLDQYKQPYPFFAREDTGNAVSQLTAATNDPKRTEQDQTFGTNHINYTASERHPVLEGVAAPGESVALLSTDSGVSYTWFEEYSGQTLANTTVPPGDYFSTQPGQKGPGIAVNEQTRTVLAAGLGLSREMQSDALTPAAKRLLTNSVTYLSTEPSATVAADQPAHATPGDRISATFNASGLDAATVRLAERSTLSASNLTLSVEGERAAFGERLDVGDAHDGTLTVTVTSDADAAGTVALETTLETEGADRPVSIVTGPTAVYTPPLTVGEDVGRVGEAMEMARPGTTVYVQNGTYVGQVTADVPNVTITAAPGASPTLRAPASLADFESVLRVEEEHVTVEGLRVVGKAGDDDYYGIHVLDHHTTVQDVTVTHSGTGIHLADIASNVTDSTVRNVTLTNVSDGLVVGVGSGYEQTNGLHVTDVTVQNATTAFFMESGSGVTFERVHVRNATEGFATWAPTDTVLRNSTFRDTDTAVVFGDAAQNLTVTGNVITDSDVGVTVRGSDRQTGRITSNVIAADTGVSFENKQTPTVAVHYNNLSGSTVAAQNTAPWWSDDPPAYEPDLRLNYFGPRGPNASAVSNVRYDPFLTAPPTQVDREHTVAIGTDLHLPANGTYSVGIPGPTTQSVRDVLGPSFNGTVERYVPANDSWQPVGNHSRADLDALGAVRVTPSSDARAVLTFAGEHPPGPPSERPPEATPGNGQTKRTLDAGWNYVSARAYGPVGDVLATQKGVSAVEPVATGPASQLGPNGTLDSRYAVNDTAAGPNVSAFTGYRVRATHTTTYRSALRANPTVYELYTDLGLEQPSLTGLDTNLTAASELGASDQAATRQLFAAASERADRVAATTDNRTAVTEAARQAIREEAKRLGLRLPEHVVDRLADAAVAERAS